MIPDAVPCNPLTGSSSKWLVQTSHQPKPKVKPMALSVSDTDSSQTEDVNTSSLYFLTVPNGKWLLGHFPLNVEWDDRIYEAMRFDLGVLSPFYRKHLPQTHLGRLGVSLLSFHTTFVSFTGLEFQCRTRHCETVSRTSRTQTSFMCCWNVVQPYQGPARIDKLQRWDKVPLNV